MTAYRPIRRGITLIEMMVAMALALGIMLILTESFKMALDFVRGAHSTGELMSQLNGAGILLTRDLQYTTTPGPEHSMFTDSKTATNGPRLSDQRLDDPTWLPPVNGGFFRLVAPDPGAEAFTDAQGFKINLPAINHQLHFTSYLPLATNPGGFTTQTVRGTPYASETAEIAYFLTPMGKKTSVSGEQLYNLIRRERLVAKSTMELPSLAYQPTDQPAEYADVVSTPSPTITTPNTFSDVMIAGKRMALPNSFGSTHPRFGEDIVVSNVLSFEIQADWTPRPSSGVSPPRPFANISTGALVNTDAPYDFLPGGVFDTGNTATPVMAARIKGLQITIRVYDPRVKTTRQNTWKFAM